MLSFSSDLTALPARLQRAIREQQADAEILIAWVQLAIVLLFAVVYAAAPKAFPEMIRFEPVPWVVGAYLAITLAQLGLAYLRRLAGILLGGFVVANVALLLILIWSFHISYMQPPSFSLKAPTLFSVFIFIALRALRLDVGYVLLAGFVAALGWTALVVDALAESLPGAITHNFIAYITSDRILVGAEIEKIIAILTVTVILAVAIAHARRLLIRSVSDRSARDLAETALRDLKVAQANLIQAEKMASLGQLTAGIAHEIKNPLNFVNNFASLSVELLGELKETAAPALATLGDDKRAEVDEVVLMLTGNLEKITEHGRRADGIVRSMLEHSRGGSSEQRQTDLNALVDEALNLAYHGARAQDQNFNITLEREFDRAVTPLELVPQDILRVFLNLFGNGFYAAMKRGREAADADFHPVLKVTTHDLGAAVEVRVRDNGIGIGPELRDKLFLPFFTTKPTGEGTGLGLSISYDIVTQQHGGTITVDSRVGEFTEFTVRLPRERQAIQHGAAN